MFNGLALTLLMPLPIDFNMLLLLVSSGIKPRVFEFSKITPGN